MGEVEYLREWQRKVADACGLSEVVEGYGLVIHDATDGALEMIRSAFDAERDHSECPEWCDDCEAWERPMSCEPCHGSGCDPATGLGAYAPCEWCTGDGRKHEGESPLNLALREVNRIVRDGGTPAERETARARIEALLAEVE